MNQPAQGESQPPNTPTPTTTTPEPQTAAISRACGADGASTDQDTPIGVRIDARTAANDYALRTLGTGDLYGMLDIAIDAAWAGAHQHLAEHYRAQGRQQAAWALAYETTCLRCVDQLDQLAAERAAGIAEGRREAASTIREYTDWYASDDRHATAHARWHLLAVADIVSGSDPDALQRHQRLVDAADDLGVDPTHVQEHDSGEPMHIAGYQPDPLRERLARLDDVDRHIAALFRSQETTAAPSSTSVDTLRDALNRLTYTTANLLDAVGRERPVPVNVLETWRAQLDQANTTLATYNQRAAASPTVTALRDATTTADAALNFLTATDVKREHTEWIAGWRGRLNRATAVLRGLDRTREAERHDPNYEGPHRSRNLPVEYADESAPEAGHAQ